MLWEDVEAAVKRSLRERSRTVSERNIQGVLPITTSRELSISAPDSSRGGGVFRDGAEGGGKQVCRLPARPSAATACRKFVLKQQVRRGGVGHG